MDGRVSRKGRSRYPIGNTYRMNRTLVALHGPKEGRPLWTWLCFWRGQLPGSEALIDREPSAVFPRWFTSGVPTSRWIHLARPEIRIVLAIGAVVTFPWDKADP